MQQCPRCNTQFQPKTHNQKYCSQGCQVIRGPRICVDCGSRFAIKAKINGIPKHLGRRTRCLECSPFRGQVIDTPEQRIEKNKIKCARYYKENKETLIPKMSKYKTLTCIYRKQQLVSLVSGCQVCGYNKASRNIAFHHLGNKAFNISQREFSCAKSTLADELKKCVCICHMCHGEAHDGNLDSQQLERLNLEFIKAVDFWLLETKTEYEDRCGKSTVPSGDVSIGSTVCSHHDRGRS